MNDLSDIGNSRRFVKQYRSELKYVEEWKSWARYDGKRWRAVDQAIVIKMAKAVVEDLRVEAAKSDTSKEAWSWAWQYGMMPRLTAMVELSKGDLAVHASEFDSDRWLLNLENKTIDLRTSQPKDHDPNDMITKLAPFEYDPKATAPRWDTFLLEVFDSDKELAAYFQRLVGYAATGDVREDIVAISYGSGSNGKSAAFATLATLLGDYAHSAPPTLITRQGMFQNKPYDEVNLIGARFVTIAETESGKQLDENSMKRYSGREQITIEGKYEKPVQVSLQCKLFIYTNNLPTVEEMTNAVWRRIRVIPFTVQFQDPKRYPDTKHPADSKLTDKLLAEASGILNWIIAGAKLWYEDGLNEPESVKLATKDYKDDQDVLSDFIEEQCYLDASAKTKSSKLYDAYTRWLDEDEPVMSKVDFGRKLSAHGLKSKKSHGTKTFFGIGLQSERISDRVRSEVSAAVRDFDPDEYYDPD